MEGESNVEKEINNPKSIIINSVCPSIVFGLPAYDGQCLSLYRFPHCGGR